ncbi:MAG: class I SAM-dependent methyltransferase [Bacteroidetes bacterium]|nr:MAG: class I SAM-dependent methyltransferase [Bacteroidota bacterium]
MTNKTSYYIKDFGFKELEIGKVYASWIFSIFKPYLGERIMEAGCGLGLMIANYKDQRPLILATDIHDGYLDFVRSRYANNSHIKVHRFDLEHPTAQMKKSIKKYGVDTIVTINVLEHIRNDTDAIKNMYELLSAGGRLLIFVPALPQIYGSVDEGFCHFRRYTKKELESKVVKAGFQIVSIRYFNLAGIMWWYIMGKILKRNNIPRMTGNLLNIFVPILERVETIFPPPIGQSLIVIAQKTS